MKTVELFFDVGSSYSYLAATQMAGVAERTGATVRWRPFLLGAVFKATGNDMPARVPAKLKWMLGDMQQWCAHYGIPFRLPTRFPLVTLRTQRFLAGIELVDPAKVAPAALVLFNAYWGENQDPTVDSTLVEAAGAAGISSEVAIAAIDAQATKDHLRATTDEAVTRGAFGAPTMFVGDVMFWGNDRIPLLERHLAR